MRRKVKESAGFSEDKDGEENVKENESSEVKDRKHCMLVLLDTV